MKPDSVRVSEALAETGPQGQASGDGRRGRRDVGTAPGTSGGPLGLSGVERRALGYGWLIGMGIASLVIFLDIVTQTFGAARRDVGLPVVEELSSLLTMTVAIFTPAAVAVWLRRAKRGWWRATLTHLVAFGVFFGLHVGGFELVREAAFPLLLDRPYDPGPVVSGSLYEAVKDAPVYVAAAAGFWWLLGWLGRQAASASPEPAWFDIRDGARLVRTPVADILAVRSAGNYAEFLLADGRTPLMRASLSALETRLAPFGFVRTHRSWLVNPARMSGLRPAGSGDYTVELGTLEAPLSRRFPQALAALRS